MKQELTVLAVTGLVVFGITSAYADHVDGHIDPDTLKSSYTYSIVEQLPSGYNTPPEYNKVIQDGIQDGLNSWEDIDEFYYTYDSSNADILVILKVHEPVYIGSFYHGEGTSDCITNNKIQCQIIIYVDVNFDGKQTLQSYESIKRTTAHEFGHNLGLPHHTDKDHIMFSEIAEAAYTYNVVGINTPNLTLLTSPDIQRYYNTPNWIHINQTTLNHPSTNKEQICNFYEIHKIDKQGICYYHNSPDDPIQHHTTQQFLEYIKDYIQHEEERWHMALIVDIIHRLSVELYNMIK